MVVERAGHCRLAFASFFGKVFCVVSLFVVKIKIVAVPCEGLAYP